MLLAWAPKKYSPPKKISLHLEYIPLTEDSVKLSVSSQDTVPCSEIPYYAINDNDYYLLSSIELIQY